VAGSSPVWSTKIIQHQWCYIIFVCIFFENYFMDKSNIIIIAKFFRDFLSVVAGTTFLFLINIYYSYDINQISNISLMDNFFILIFVFLSLSFFCGKILQFIASLWLNIFHKVMAILFKDTRKYQIDDAIQVLNFIMGKKIDTDKIPSIYDEEIVLKTIHERETIKDAYERNITKLHFISYLIGGTVVFFIVSLNWYLLLLIFYLTIQDIGQRIYISKRIKKIKDGV
ncbi:MAG: hypothetical protein KAJ48_03600, partial [Elusimicrobiales bacterium]|nr:hypothetical protein [Elusimicrobiales bacterium]